jgi:hypothetical protein
VRVPPLPFSLDPLIAEAKRRARQRRLLIAVAVVVVGGLAAALTFGLRSSNDPIAVARPGGGFARISGMTLVASHRASSECWMPHWPPRLLPAYCVHLVPPEAGGLDQVWELTAGLKQLGGTREVPIFRQELHTPVQGPSTVEYQVRKFPRRPGRYGARALALSPSYTGFRGDQGFYQAHSRWAINGGVAGEFPVNGSSPVRYVFAWVAHRSVVWISVSGGSPAQAQQIARLAGPV